VILVAGFAAIWLLRRRPGLSFALAASMMWLASPVAVLHTPALMLVAFAPLAWPMVRGGFAHDGAAAGPKPDLDPGPTRRAAAAFRP
jgi:hypothetical protein